MNTDDLQKLSAYLRIEAKQIQKQCDEWNKKIEPFYNAIKSLPDDEIDNKWRLFNLIPTSPGLPPPPEINYKHRLYEHCAQIERMQTLGHR